MLRTIPLKYVLPLLGLTVSAFIFNTSEFMPIGLLIDISQSFGMTEDQTGIHDYHLRLDGGLIVPAADARTLPR